MIEKYTHHGKEVYVKSELKGQHRDYCLCYSCEIFNVNNPILKCKIADELYNFCVKHNTVTPVFECPKYKGI
ncbi:MAG: hypothetical protein PHE15_01700 [Dehalococcoidales bacterium]|nr:hypothetical protein [Dehalococcoidales bacterium]